MTQRPQESAYRTGESAYEKNEKNEIIVTSSIQALKALQDKYAEAKNQLPEGEGRNIFSRLYDEVSGKIVSFDKAKKKIQKHTERKHIETKSSIGQQKLKNELPVPTIANVQVKNDKEEQPVPPSVQPTAPIAPISESREIPKQPKRGFFSGASDALFFFK